MVRLDGAFAVVVYKSVALALTDSQEQFLGFELTGSGQVYKVRRVHKVHEVHEVRRVHKVHKVHKVHRVRKGTQGAQGAQGARRSAGPWGVSGISCIERVRRVQSLTGTWRVQFTPKLKKLRRCCENSRTSFSTLTHNRPRGW